MSDPDTHADTTAAELALGVLEGEERAAAERRRLSDRAFAQEVEAWEHRLARIAVDEAPERQAPAAAWHAIEGRLGDTASVTTLRLRRSLTIWRSATAVAAATAAALAAVLVLRPASLLQTPGATAPAAAQGQVQTASLSNATTPGRISFVAVVDVSRGELVLTPIGAEGAPGKSPELWAVPQQGKPISLGVARFGAPVRLKLSGQLVGDGPQTLAVSLEPSGGSPSGQPTGPIIASGSLKAL